MDFRSVLSKASENQGRNVQKRYSLAVGPPKKDPKVKGVHSAAVQAFLKRKDDELRKKEMDAKRQKEELLAKRVELKHDRKARAMASRTKDNFKGYNGIPIEEKPRKRRSHEEMAEERRQFEEERHHITDEEYYEYSQTESEQEEPEPEEVVQKPAKVPEKPKISKRPPSTPMNFSDLLKLAEKKQFEPVEMKNVKKTEERLKTAEELREQEFLERKSKKTEKEKDRKAEKEIKAVTSSNSLRRETSERELKSTKLPRSSADSTKLARSSADHAKLTKSSEEKKPFSKGKPLSSSSGSGNDKKPRPPFSSEKLSSLSSKSSQSGKIKPVQSGSCKSTSGGNNGKLQVNNLVKSGSSSQTSGFNSGPTGAKKPVPNRDIKKKAAIPPSTTKSAAPPRPGVGNGSSARPVSAGQICSVNAGSSSQTKLGSRVGPVRPGSTVGLGPGRPGVPATAPKPKCTVVSETISSKNFVAKSQMGGLRSPPPEHGPFVHRPGPPQAPGPIGHKRRWNNDDDDYDSEMDDFIDDEGESQDEISKHIRDIFGYDRNKYKDESDYALRYMEASWKDIQKEEAISLRLGMQEDLEEMRKEEEELKQKQALRAKKKRI
ncbi:protein SPT2 homolog isoform X1 [Latimeria chalumnae]|uniref:protein SPT2 homolog isoform X1 n=1 Tax=Latimeria chalumnae TaxID=7897 RepID=UPI0003C1A591|nr:PREDICTED: protein SPT2 homolog isoform X1 [Latimeria chalumnae]|eukprot:XP_005990542.1 PREDICTED: protein SPT2 homolog isoform X1 [Latimeria chalumnae]